MIGNNRNKIVAAVVFMALITVAGCKKFLDVNESPNAPKTATEDLLLPSSQLGIGLALGTSLNINGSFYAQFWTQSPSSSQYKTIDQYQTVPTDFNRPWATLYSDALQDIEVLRQSKFTNYVAIAWLEKAYTFQLLTDAWGDVPLKEAFGGTGNLSPKFDPQQEVYDSIIAWTKRGIALTTASSENYPGADDLIFGGGAAGMANWKEFGNTLLLKVYLRLSEVDPLKARTGVETLYATNPTFLTKDAKISYLTVGGNQNPLYAEGVGLNRVANIVASSTAVNAMTANNDPRLKLVYTPNTSGDVIGVPQGSFAVQPPVTPSLPNAITGARFSTATGSIAAAAPVKFISAAESYFLQAEAVARGWATGNVTTLFQAGIKASFDALGVSATDYNTYITTAPDAQLPADVPGKVKAIITQKYYAMNGFQGFEAWTEWRRTGYPNFLVKSQASSLGTNELPARLLYPDTEITRNANFPGLKLITERVWWDKN
ncbi:MAG: SusD/RagB family nutrient-binding outer membrane lipoprotein [Chitinophagaceae bacterium]|nr:MAG: SusD/RagB family nutrient-binding outer membrane lipoprotein [Chitinophagaceae bacterium]